ncbi:MAG: 50S ribosomal protein L19 [Candidatus Eisenbacteria bacterium]|nr:50S ribosomal protein L19 [Candidatus Eisenbacteria bacterium]
MDVIRNIESGDLKPGIPDFGPGDTVRVSVRVVEGEKQRLQLFQGVVIGRRGGGTRESITVRKISDGVAVERIFPIHSPNLQAIEVVRRGRVRRAKLTYLRGRKGRSARIREQSLAQAAKRAKKQAPTPQIGEGAEASAPENEG